MFAISLIWPGAVAEIALGCNRPAGCLERLDAGHDVDHGLGRRTRHRGASDVLDCADEPRREHAAQDGRLLLERDGPGWIVRNDFDRRLE
jgi:hypothetical protein